MIAETKFSAIEALLDFDRRHLWHPYSSMVPAAPVLPVTRAHGVRLQLDDGSWLIDGMSSWWAAIHGYNHPRLNQAIQTQVKDMAHVMFGGLTHAAATDLGQVLLPLLPAGLETIFYCDSGSVAVEVAMKMALQYQRALGHSRRCRFLTVRGGYHGDTWHAMSVCDPDTGMHSLFQGTLPQQVFAPRPGRGFSESWEEKDGQELVRLAQQHSQELAALILEPVVQGAGGMNFYHPQYLRVARELCDNLGLLLICDEIATGFGRTGTLFACEHAGISPDILCLGKALTGGYMSLGATVCRGKIAEAISQSPPGRFMHGPTFMANPLACSVARASVELLLERPWRDEVANIACGLKEGLAEAQRLAQVRDVRVLGGIGVIETAREVETRQLPDLLRQHGVWLRPFGRLIYTMPPYGISQEELACICRAMVAIASAQPCAGKGELAKKVSD